jgi:tetratricopeptide (TPR) repeat protein
MYELQRGRLSAADRMIDRSLQYVPDYAAALLARGRIQLARAQFVEAAATLEHAARLNPLTEYLWAFADALRSLKRIDEAIAVERQLVQQGADDPRTLALYLSTRREDSGKAMELAKRELENRSDIFTLDALAWSLASAGKTDEASALMTRALAEGTQDARLFLHAAVIAKAAGRPVDAARWHRRASKLRFMLLPSELGVLRTGS